jgi:solute carrier family 25 citrate transporter 1
MVDPQELKQNLKYRNVFQTASVIVREEGFKALYKGVVPTMLRQGFNQAVNFTAYQSVKSEIEKHSGNTTEPWQHMLIGGATGGLGPTANNPLDVVKTRMQKQIIYPGEVPKYRSLIQSCIVIAKEEGVSALWKGLTPRLMRIMPGQAITFMTYEFVSNKLQDLSFLQRK